jgi:hypothetical protein
MGEKMEDVKFDISVGVNREPVWAVVRMEQMLGLNVRRFVPIGTTEFTLEQLHALHTQAVARQQPDSLIACITKAIDTAQQVAALSTPSTL